MAKTFLKKNNNVDRLILSKSDGNQDSVEFVKEQTILAMEQTDKQRIQTLIYL